MYIGLLEMKWGLHFQNPPICIFKVLRKRVFCFSSSDKSKFYIVSMVQLHVRIKHLKCNYSWQYCLHHLKTVAPWNSVAFPKPTYFVQICNLLHFQNPPILYKFTSELEIQGNFKMFMSYKFKLLKQSKLWTSFRFKFP